MDKTYLDRVRLRAQLIKDRPQDVLAANAVIAPAVQEFYTWMMSTYLPQRFPTVFKLSESSTSTHPSHLQNLATNETLPLTTSTSEEALRLLGSNVDDDFL